MALTEPPDEGAAPMDGVAPSPETWGILAQPGAPLSPRRFLFFLSNL